MGVLLCCLAGQPVCPAAQVAPQQIVACSLIEGELGAQSSSLLYLRRHILIYVPQKGGDTLEELLVSHTQQKGDHEFH